MKILYLTGYRYPNSLDEPLTSGDLRYSFTLSRALAELGHEVTVITRREDGDPLLSQLDGVRIARYKSELSKIFGTSFDISINRFKLFKKLLPDTDIVICNSPLSLEHFAKISPPIIYIASGLEDVRNYSYSPKEIIGHLAIQLLRDPLKRLTWKKAKLVNTTAWHEDTTLMKWGVPHSKIGKISSGVDLSRFVIKKGAAAKLRKTLKIKSGEHIILSVSRFTPAKGVIETVQAFDKLNRDDIKLIIVGVQHSHDSSYYAKVLQTIYDSDHKKNIVLQENVPERELSAYYSVADVVSVFSKDYDPLPTVIIEAMACGTPVVSTYYKTRKQFIKDGHNGLFVKEHDLEDWVEKINKLFNNKALRDRLAKNARTHVEKNFGWLEIAKQYLRIIKHER